MWDKIRSMITATKEYWKLSIIEDEVNDEDKEESFWKPYIKENWRSFFNPPALFMLLLVGGMIGIFFIPLAVLVCWLQQGGFFYGG